MKKTNNNISLLMAFVASIGSIVALFIVTFNNSKFDITTALTWNNIEPFVAVIITVLTSVGFYFSSRGLKNRDRRIFIIYSHSDKEHVKLLTESLSDYGIKSITDEQIKIGENIKEVVKRSIEEVDKVLFVFSSNTNNSLWIEEELKIALLKRKQIFPIMIGEATLPEQLNGIKYAKLDKIDYDTVEPIFRAILN